MKDNPGMKKNLKDMNITFNPPEKLRKIYTSMMANIK